MGEAKRRGSFEHRVAQALERQRIEDEQRKKRAVEELRQRQEIEAARQRSKDELFAGSAPVMIVNGEPRHMSRATMAALLGISLAGSARQIIVDDKVKK
jgi:hypothetical protein